MLRVIFKLVCLGLLLPGAVQAGSGGALRAAEPPSPSVTFVDIPAEVVSGTTVYFKVGFASTAHRLRSVVFEQPSTAGWKELSTHDVADMAGKSKDGFLVMTASCELLNGQSRQRVKHRMVLRDSSGRSGNPWMYSFDCVGERSQDIIGEATGWSASGRQLDDIRVESRPPLHSTEAGPELSTSCRSGHTLQFCRSLPARAEAGRSFTVITRLKNTGTETLPNVQVVETLDRTLRAECLDLNPGEECSLTYSARVRPKHGAG